MLLLLLLRVMAHLSAIKPWLLLEVLGHARRRLRVLACVPATVPWLLLGRALLRHSS